MITERFNNSSIIFCLIILTGFGFGLPAICAQENFNANSPLQFITCSPDKLAVFPDEPVKLQAWVKIKSNKPIKYSWSSSAGTLKGMGATASWDLSGAMPGVYSATVKASYDENTSADCSVRVVVKYPSLDLKSGKRATGRAFLTPEKTETEGYGLYSYLLLGAPSQNNSEREKYLKVIEAWLKFSNINELEKYIPRKELNITYVPVKKPAREKEARAMGDGLYGIVAEWVLINYDYARARAVLRHLPGDHNEGPYIISSFKPLSDGSISPPYLYQDQSDVPLHLLSMWIKEFICQAAQENFWEKRTGRQLVIKIRTTIGILSEGLPQVLKSLDEWIEWKEKIN